MLDGMDIGLVVGTEVDPDGFVEAQVDVYGEKRAGVAGGETCFPAGLYGRPHDPVLDPAAEPDAASACGATYSYYGGRLHVWPETDPRQIAGLPKAKARGSFYFYGGAATAPAWLEARVLGAGSEMHGVADRWTLRGPVVLGADDASSPVALADKLLAYLDALVPLISAGIKGAGPTGAASAGIFDTAVQSIAALRAQIAATLATTK
jgi:hypothetical protein